MTDTDTSDTASKAHLTAIARKRPSAPARMLCERGMIQGNALDYGCGRGRDCLEYSMWGYDPHYRPHPPEENGPYDTILCTYVLNVVTWEQQEQILAHIRQLLKPTGKAYVTVRRDVKRDHVTSKGTLQRRVYLPWRIVHRTSGYVTYCVTP